MFSSNSYKEKKVFVGNVSLFSDEEDLKKHFQQFGLVLYANIPKHPTSQRSRRFGFVTFNSPLAAQAALAAHPSALFLNGRQLVVKHAFKQSFEEGGVKPGTKSPSKIFVGGLPRDTTLADLESHFGQFGPWTSINWPEDPQKRRGYAFITYQDQFFALTACQHRYQEINGKSVEVKMAIPKAENVFLPFPKTHDKVKDFSGHWTNLTGQNQPTASPHLYPIEALYTSTYPTLYYPFLGPLLPSWQIQQQNSFWPVTVNQNAAPSDSMSKK